MGINLTLVGAAALPKGAIVKLGTNGKVSAVAAATDQPLGMVTTGSKAADEDVTVLTPFIAVVKGKASGAGCDAGVEVAAEALDGTDDLMDYAVAAATNRVVGVVIEGGADGEEIWVGLYGHNYIKA
jgi:hypothetical protein